MPKFSSLDVNSFFFGGGGGDGGVRASKGRFYERTTFKDDIGSEKGDLYNALWDRVTRCSHLNSAVWTVKVF